MMLRLESLSTKNECRFCHNVIDMDSIIAQGETVSCMTFSQRKDWLHAEDAAARAASAVERPTVEQDCEKCDNDLMYFRTAQTRSVDEGQTVYYECTKCSHIFAINT